MFQVEAVRPVKKTLQRGTWWEMCSSPLMLRAQIPFASFPTDTPVKPSGSFPRLEGTGASWAPEHWWGRGGCLNPHELQLLGGWCRTGSVGSSEGQTSSPRCEMCSGTMRVTWVLPEELLPGTQCLVPAGQTGLRKQSGVALSSMMASKFWPWLCRASPVPGGFSWVFCLFGFVYTSVKA